MNRTRFFAQTMLGVFVLTFLWVSLATAQSYSYPLYQGRTAVEWGSLLTDASPSIRATAADSLRRMGVNARPALAHLTKALSDSNPDVIENAVWALGFIGKEAEPALPQIKAVIHSSHPAKVQTAAIAAIGLIGTSDAETVALLTRALHHESSQVCSAAALALGALGQSSAPAIPDLIELTQDAEPIVCHSAVIALGRIGYPAEAALPALRDLATNSNKQIRRDAEMAVNRIEQELTRQGRPPLNSTTIARTQPPPAPKPVPVTPPAKPSKASAIIDEDFRPTRPKEDSLRIPKGEASVSESPAVTIVRPVRILSSDKPRYTELAARHKVAGDIVLNVQFKADGTIGEIEVVKGLGYGLDDSAIQTAKRLKFQPAERNGQRVDSVSKVQYSFVQIN
ncbi:MAG: TonB family protein [Acidobacteria bacterium]|nr:TonB family protein [Acidobacteriota bacterium]